MSILARIIECKDGLVWLRKQDDEQVAIPVEKFSEADRALLLRPCTSVPGEECRAFHDVDAGTPVGPLLPQRQVRLVETAHGCTAVVSLAACRAGVRSHLVFLYSVGLFIIPILAGGLLGG